MTLSKRAQDLLYYTGSDQPRLRAILIFAAQNPGFEFGNYWSGDRARSLAAYYGDARPVTRQLQQIRDLRDAFATLTDDIITEAARRAYSGRLSFAADGSVDYYTGQYWPTEYRQAALAVLRQAIQIASDRRLGVAS